MVFPVAVFPDAVLLRPLPLPLHLRLPQLFAPVHGERRLSTPFPVRRVVATVPVPVHLVLCVMPRRRRLDDVGVPVGVRVMLAFLVPNLPTTVTLLVVQDLEQRALHQRIRAGAVRVRFPPLPLLLPAMALLRLFRLFFAPKPRLSDTPPVSNEAAPLRRERGPPAFQRRVL